MANVYQEAQAALRELIVAAWPSATTVFPSIDINRFSWRAALQQKEDGGPVDLETPFVVDDWGEGEEVEEGPLNAMMNAFTVDVHMVWKIGDAGVDTLQKLEAIQTQFARDLQRSIHYYTGGKFNVSGTPRVSWGDSNPVNQMLLSTNMGLFAITVSTRLIVGETIS